MKQRVAIVLLLFATLMLIAQKSEGKSEGPLTCRDWQSKVDSNMNPEANFDPRALSDEAKIKGFECLLNLENNQSRARFSGATRMDVSQTFAPAKVNVAALFYISYVFTGRWDHSQAVALRGQEGRVDNASDIRRAYKSYRAWLSRVKRIGLAQAASGGLDPLTGSNVHWY